MWPPPKNAHAWGTWVVQLVKHLSSAQVMIPEFWDWVPSWAPHTAESQLLSLPLPFPTPCALCLFIHCTHHCSFLIFSLVCVPPNSTWAPICLINKEIKLHSLLPADFASRVCYSRHLIQIYLKPMSPSHTAPDTADEGHLGKVVCE